MSRTTRRKNYKFAQGQDNNPFWYVRQRKYGDLPRFEPWIWQAVSKERIHRDRPRRGMNRQSYKEYIDDKTRNDCRRAMQRVRQGEEFTLTDRTQRVYYRGWGWKCE